MSSDYSPPPRILFMGTPDYALVTLRALYEAGHHLAGVFTQPDKPSGRGQKLNSPPCALFAKEKGLPLFQPVSLKKDEASLQAIRELKPDLIIVVAYGLLLPKDVLEIPTLTTLNLHASLLPKYRGAAPIQWALIDGNTETGVTLMRITEKMDAGPVYAQVKVPINADDNESTLFEKCAQAGTRLLLDYLPRIPNLSPIPQDESLATHARKIQKEDGRLDFNQSAVQLGHLIRGIQLWPTAHTFVDNKRLKIYDAQALQEPAQARPGQVYRVDAQGFYIACREGSLLAREVQLEGKKRVAGAEFARGYFRSLPVTLG